MGMKRAREKSGLTVLQAARAMDVSTVAVYNWESGESWPTADKLPKLAALYGCTVDELLKEE